MGIYDLYKAASDGDQTAEDRLFDRLSVRFRYLVNNRVWDPDDAEDLVQTSLMVVLRDYKSLNGHPKFEAWAYKILDNRILGYVGSKSRTSQRHVEFDDSVWIAAKGKNLELESDLLKCLSKIRKVNVTYARILALHFQGHTTDEICKKLDMTPSNLYTTLSRARAALTKCLDENAQ